MWWLHGVTDQGMIPATGTSMKPLRTLWLYQRDMEEEPNKLIRTVRLSPEL